MAMRRARWFRFGALMPLVVPIDLPLPRFLNPLLFSAAPPGKP